MIETMRISAENGVTIDALVNPPAREWPNRLHTATLAWRAKGEPEDGTVDWEPKDLTDSIKGMAHVRLNSCGYASLDGPGYLGTADLNGCVSIAAAYRDGYTIQTFQEHYDADDAREVGKSGILKVSELLANFAGRQAVRVAVAYWNNWEPLPSAVKAYDPAEFPVTAITEGCRALPPGSSVLMIPYETSDNGDDPRTGHMLYVGHSGSGQLDFGWNGYELPVREPAQWDEACRSAGRQLRAEHQKAFELGV